MIRTQTRHETHAVAVAEGLSNGGTCRVCRHRFSNVRPPSCFASGIVCRECAARIRSEATSRAHQARTSAILKRFIRNVSEYVVERRQG